MHVKFCMQICTPRSKAFTLVEMLVVVAIIAILAAIAFPAYSSFLRRATTAKCISNLKQLGVAINMYAADNNGRLPGPGASGIGPRLTPSTSGSVNMLNRIYPYLGMPTPPSAGAYCEIARCPAVTGSLLGNQPSWKNLVMYVAYSANDVPNNMIAFNEAKNPAGASVGPWGRPPDAGWPLAALSGRIRSSAVDYEGNSPPKLSTIPAIYEPNNKYPPRGKGSWPWPVPTECPHGEYMNVLFFDWHVGQVQAGAFSPSGK